MNFDQEICNNNGIKLKVNFFGIKDGKTDSDSFKMSFYAFHEKSGSPVFSCDLNLEDVRKLYNHMEQISLVKDHDKVESGKFIEINPLLEGMLSSLSGLDEDDLSQLISRLDEESDEGLEKIAAKQKSIAREQELKNLEELLLLESKGNIVSEVYSRLNLKPYCAKQPEKIFQNWIERNCNRIFGVEYTKRHDARKISINSEGDILMESIDGFLDLIELKRPSMKQNLLVYDKSHKTYFPSGSLSQAIGQSLQYLQELDNMKLILESQYKVKIIRPRVKIIAGRTKGFNENQYKALKMLNSNLTHIQIISYDYLLSCGKKMLEHFS